MTQPPYGQPPHPDAVSQYPGAASQHPAYVAPTAPASVQGPAAGIGLGITATVWAALGLFGHTTITLYLGFGAIMTHSLDGVFGDSTGGAFNTGLLLFAIIAQLAGFALSVIALVLGITAKRRRLRRSTTALVLGIVSTAIFLLIGLIQLPLVGLLFEIM